MSELEPPDAETASEEQVIGYLRALLERVKARVARGESEDDALLAEVAGDRGVVALLGAAYEDGKSDAALAVARAGGADESPTFAGLESRGEVLATYKGEHLCLRCTHRPVCVVPRSAPDDMLVTVRRCLAFDDATG